MVGKDLRCPECSSFAVDVDPDFSLDTCTQLLWTCENGHVVMAELTPTVVLREKVIRKREWDKNPLATGKPGDPPKAEGASS